LGETLAREYQVRAALHLTEDEYKRVRAAAGLELDAAYARRATAWLTDLLIAYRADHPAAQVGKELRDLLASYRPETHRYVRSLEETKEVVFKGELVLRIRLALGVTEDCSPAVKKWNGALKLSAYTYLAVMLYLDHVAQVATTINFSDLVHDQHRPADLNPRFEP